MRFDSAHRPWRESLAEQNIHIVTPNADSGIATTDKWALIDSLHRALCKRENVDEAMCAEIRRELIERERLMSTGIGEQMAIPHAVVSGVDRFMTQCAIIRDGLEFESIDGSRTYIVVMLVAPKSGLQEHLKVMAEIARVFYRAETRQKCIGASTPAEVLEIIRGAQV